MATNKRDLKAYVRFDGTGRIIPGSLVLRRNKPKNGNWKETQAYECCDTFECIVPSVTLSTTATGFPVDAPGCTPYVRFKCDGVTIWEISNLSTPPNPSLEVFFNIVSTTYSWVGIWSLDGETVTLEINGGLAKALCSTGELTMVVGVQCPV
jgi:hypothetical protein